MIYKSNIFSKCFLYVFGCYDNDYIENITTNIRNKIRLKHNEINYKDDSEHSEDLFYDINYQDVYQVDCKKVDTFLTEMARCVIKLVLNKASLRDDITILCFEYCCMMQEKAFTNGKTTCSVDEFIKVLKLVVNDHFDSAITLATNYKTNKNHTKNINKCDNHGTRFFNQTWFGECLLTKRKKDSMIVHAILRDDYHKRAYIAREVGEKREETSRITGVCKDKYYMSSIEFSKLTEKLMDSKIIIFLVVHIVCQGKLPKFYLISN